MSYMRIVTIRQYASTGDGGRDQILWPVNTCVTTFLLLNKEEELILIPDKLCAFATSIETPYIFMSS